MSTTSKGRWAEEIVGYFLEDKGYTVMHRNFMCAHGEIDIVAEDDDTILLVEVRMRKAGAAVTGAESINNKKANTMLLCAREYYERACMPEFNYRIDVAQVEYTENDDQIEYTIEYIENALDF